MPLENRSNQNENNNYPILGRYNNTAAVNVNLPAAQRTSHSYEQELVAQRDLIRQLLADNNVYRSRLDLHEEKERMNGWNTTKYWGTGYNKDLMQRHAELKDVHEELKYVHEAVKYELDVAEDKIDSARILEGVLRKEIKDQVEEICELDEANFDLWIKNAKLQRKYEKLQSTHEQLQRRNEKVQKRIEQLEKTFTVVREEEEFASEEVLKLQGIIAEKDCQMKQSIDQPSMSSAKATTEKSTSLPMKICE